MPGLSSGCEAQTSRRMPWIFSWRAAARLTFACSCSGPVWGVSFPAAASSYHLATLCALDVRISDCTAKPQLFTKLPLQTSKSLPLPRYLGERLSEELWSCSHSPVLHANSGHCRIWCFLAGIWFCYISHLHQAVCQLHTAFCSAGSLFQHPWSEDVQAIQ